MEPRSLALRTDLILDRFSGVVIDRDEYLVIKTPSRPTYYWGNYLLMKRPPRVGDLDRWIGLFEKEIGPRMDRGFIALTWDSVDGDQEALTAFADFGFSIQRSTILTAGSVRRPSKYNSDLVVRPLESDDDWDGYVDIHFDPDWGYGDPASQRHFLKSSGDRFRAFTNAGQGVRFGVESEGKLIGDAGLYWDETLGRFNEVATHREYRRQGVCSTLVYELAKFAFDTKQLETLVMEADEDYHASKIYESIGFTQTEKLVKLEWTAKSQP